MKKFFIILLSFILLLPAFGTLAIYSSFKINQDKIAKTICIQRETINNSCNGRCVLQKSLKKFEDNEKRMDNLLKEKAELVYIQHSLIINLEVPLVIQSSKKQYPSFDKKPISVSLSNFRPPACFI